MKYVTEEKNRKTPLGKQPSQKLRVLVKNELTRRFQKNPSYSLRAFSKSVGVDQSLLSKILKGERDFSFSAALKLGQSIGLSMEELQNIMTTEATAEGRATYDPLNEDQFMIISGWHHFAILELMQTGDFKPNSSWIAKRLRISVNDTNFAIERLQKCGFIKKISSQKWICTAPNNSWFNSKHTNLARRTLQQQLLERARVAVGTVRFEDRENASLTIAINKELLAEIKRRIHRFKDEINELAMSYGKADEVYQTCIAFFPLTNQEEK